MDFLNKFSHLAAVVVGLGVVGLGVVGFGVVALGVVSLGVVGLQAGFFDPFPQHFKSNESGPHSSTGGR